MTTRASQWLQFLILALTVALTTRGRESRVLGKSSVTTQALTREAKERVLGPSRARLALKAVGLTQLLSSSPKHLHYSPSQGKCTLGLSATWIPIAWTLQRALGTFQPLSLWFFNQLPPRKARVESPWVC